MIKPEVTTLYKYFGYNQFSLQSLVNRIAWLAKLLTFNDPFDCVANFEHQFTPSVRREFIKHLNSKSGKEFDESYIETYLSNTKRYLSQIGVLCLSEVFNDILMWSHYADSHRGFVIGYERTENNYLGKSAIPVTYTNDLPLVTPIDLIEQKKEKLEKLWLHKSKHWCYEREWRCYIEFGDTEQSMNNMNKTIIFGLRMPDSKKKIIKNILKTQNIIFKQAHKSPSKFELNIFDN